MPIIDYTYFLVGDLHIAQLSQPAVKAKLDYYIEKYERELLETVLGPVTYQQLLTAAAENPAPAPWAAFIEGATFTTAGPSMVQLYWPGFTDKTRCNLAAYVYYQYLRSEAKNLTGSGAVEPNTENATRVDVLPLQTRAYNDMVQLNKLMCAYLQANSADFPDWPYATLAGGWPDYLWRYPFESAECWRRWHKPTLFEDFFIPVNNLNI